MNRIIQITVYDRCTNDRYKFTAQSTENLIEKLIGMINEKYLNEQRLVLK